MKEVHNPFEVINSELTLIKAQLHTLVKEISLPQTAQQTSVKLLTSKDVCARLKISRVTLWSWEKKGILFPIRIGNMKRYKLSDIESISKQKV